MNIEVRAQGIELSDDLADFCRRQIVAPLRRIFDRQGPTLEIELSDLYGPKGGLDKRCRITFTMPRTRTITIVEVTEDIYKSVDYASRRFLRLVKRYKDWKLVGSRWPTKYFLAEQEQRYQPGAEYSPDDITIEEDSLAAYEQRLRDEGLSP